MRDVAGYAEVTQTGYWGFANDQARTVLVGATEAVIADAEGYINVRDVGSLAALIAAQIVAMAEDLCVAANDERGAAAVLEMFHAYMEDIRRDPLSTPEDIRAAREKMLKASRDG